MRTHREITSDPGGEICNAPKGSVDWAKRVRLEMISIVNHIHEEPERIGGYIDLVQRERVWTLLNKKDGSTFDTFEEFCRFEQPWGLGRPFEEIRPYLEAVHGKRGLELMTAPPDGRKRNGANQHTGPGKVESHLGGENPRTPGNDQRLRAILRAPSYVQDLFRQGLVSQKVAAKLGPSRPTPDQAAAIAGAVEAVRMFTKPEKLVRDQVDVKAIRSAVDKQFRQAVEETRTDPVQRVADHVSRAVSKMSRDEKVRLRRLLEDLLETP
jgi:hypothetical protein